MAHTLLGHDFTPPDLAAKVTGRAKYAEDFRQDGRPFCRLLTSTMPHARVKIDVAEALAMDGGRLLCGEEVIAEPIGVRR